MAIARQTVRLVLVAILAVGCRLEPDIGAADSGTADGSPLDGSAIDAAPVSCTTPGPGLVAWYRFEDSDPSAGVTDSGPSGLDGSCPLDCPAIVAGAIGNGLSFPEGGTSPIEVASSPAFNLTNGFTVALWMRTGVVPSVPASLTAKRIGSENNTFQLVVTATGLFSAFTDTASERSPLSSEIQVNDNSWHHVAVTWSASGMRSIAVDTDVTLVPAAVDVSFTNSSLYFAIDEDDGVLNNPYEGSMDEIRIYDRALAPDELITLAGCGP